MLLAIDKTKLQLLAQVSRNSLMLGSNGVDDFGYGLALLGVVNSKFKLSSYGCHASFRRLDCGICKPSFLSEPFYLGVGSINQDRTIARHSSRMVSEGTALWLYDRLSFSASGVN
ncbi:hypothetical protein DL768_011002 [Monosporascus sp. mg162]|nr:hypothetical protein DL768_011002 [Monosporascus sp. mg162]